jgi:hypothetical protein
MAIAAMRVAASSGFDALLAPLVFVSNAAAVALCRSLHFKLLCVVPRAGTLSNKCKVTDAMQFYYALSQPSPPAPNLAWTARWHPALAALDKSSERGGGGVRVARDVVVEEREDARRIKGDEVGREEEDEGGEEAAEWREHCRWMQHALSRARIAESLVTLPLPLPLIPPRLCLGVCDFSLPTSPRVECFRPLLSSVASGLCSEVSVWLSD